MKWREVVYAGTHSSRSVHFAEIIFVGLTTSLKVEFLN